MDQGFNILHGALFGRRSSGRVLALVGPTGHIVNALANDLQALTHLLDTQHSPVIAVTVFSGGHLKVKLIVTAIGSFFTYIPIAASSAQSWPCHTPVQSLLLGINANTDGALFEHFILHGHLVVVV